MNWDAIGAVGEVAGVVVVMLTLVYLAFQVQADISRQTVI